jgi:hypothetical protein
MKVSIDKSYKREGGDTNFHISTSWIVGQTICYWRVLSGLQVAPLAPGGSTSSSGRQAVTLRATEFSKTGSGS